MKTMSSLEAQNQFGTLLDSSQREPVTITRRGRPIAVVQAYEDYVALPLPSAEMARFMSQNFPLRGKEAGDALRRYFAGVNSLAEKEGLDPDAVTRLLNDEQ